MLYSIHRLCYIHWLCYVHVAVLHSRAARHCEGHGIHRLCCIHMLLTGCNTFAGCTVLRSSTAFAGCTTFNGRTTLAGCAAFTGCTAFIDCTAFADCVAFTGCTALTGYTAFTGCTASTPVYCIHRRHESQVSGTLRSLRSGTPPTETSRHQKRLQKMPGCMVLLQLATALKPMTRGRVFPTTW